MGEETTTVVVESTEWQGIEALADPIHYDECAVRLTELLIGGERVL